MSLEKVSYTSAEKKLLALLIKDIGKILENKRTDSATLEMKIKKWKEICGFYNSQPNIFTKRTVKQLKKCWANLKQTKRKLNTFQQAELLRTGGGSPALIENKDPVMQLVAEAAPHVDVQLDCVWDSTATFIEEHNGAEATSSAIEPDLVSPIRKKRKASHSHAKAVDEESQLRIEKIQQAIAHQKELHELRMQYARAEVETVLHQKELHQLRMETAKIELEADKARLQLANFMPCKK